MKQKIVAFLVAWLSLASTLAFAQNGFNLEGKIIGAQNQPLGDASVYLQSANNDTVLQTTFTLANGKFKFSNVGAGKYKLLVTMLGFQSFKSEVLTIETHRQLKDFKLSPQETMLKDVVINGQKKLIEKKIDRTIVNVDGLIGAAGATAMDILEKAPGVLVDQNGAMSLQGKSGITIFIDGKPTYLSGSELEGYLKSLSASTIDQIELMPNPPAKYDAAGSGGVINIKIKRSKVKGFNGTSNLSYIQGRYAKTNNSASVNYRDNKFNIFGNLSLNTTNGFSDLDINRYFSNSTAQVSPNFLQNSLLRRRSQSYNAKIGVDYYADSSTTFGLGFTGLLNPSDENTRSVSNLFNAAYQLDSAIIAINKQDRSFKNGGVNANFRKQFGKRGGEITADLDYLNYQTNADQLFDNTSYSPNGNVKGNEALIGQLPAKINIYTAKTDFSQDLTQGYKFDAGLKVSYTATDNVADYFLSKNQQTTVDYDKTNHFRYKEQINAAYANLNKDFKRFALQFGLRMENTSSKGHQLGNLMKPDSTFNRNYTGLFPTVYVQYKLDTAGHQNLTVNYGKRISRPYYQDLNPFISPLDKFTFYVGNPFLKPSYSHNFELSYAYKKLSATINYGSSKDEINETIEIVNGIYFSRPGNLGRTSTMGVSVNGNFDLSKSLSFNFFARATNIHTVSNFYTGLLDTQGTFYFGRAMFQLNLPKDWILQVDGGYQSKIVNAQFTAGGRGRANLAVSKKLSPATTIKFVANDLFYTFVNTGVINNLANTKANYRNESDTRTAVFSLSYRFGKAIANQRKHNADGAAAEQGRVKN